MIRDPYNTTPNFANTPPNPPRRSRSLWILVTCVIVLVVAIGTLLALMFLGVFSSPSSHNGTNTQPTATPATGTTPTTGATTPTANPSGGSVTPQQAVTAVTQYYSHINAKDYQDAYNLWGTAYHNSTSYQQFKAGFANTQSVSIAILPGSSVLNEGSVKVPLTIHSVDTTSSGPVTHTYQGYYIIGTEGSTWQLFSANIQ